jgi:branched-chain amino acid transport system ATP-binding protein
VIVEHDIHLVMNLADRIHVLERGATLAAGTPQEVRSNQAVIDAYLGNAEDTGELVDAAD